jgi:hypothetical protein
MGQQSPSRPDPIATLVFSEEGEKTKLTMTIECKSVGDRDALLQMRIDAGTARTLENLAEYLDRIDSSGPSVDVTAEAEFGT